LQNLQSLIDDWMSCQRSWLYLHPIFCSEDIVTKLPQEARRFAWVDTLWLTTMNETNQNPRAIDIAGKADQLLLKFKQANTRLDLIEKGLNIYLETKRGTFPRFYFLSNDELLEILSQAKVPQAVQPFLGKCFEGINAVHFEESPKKKDSDLQITQMISSEEETVNLIEPLYPGRGDNRGNVELWLLGLETMMAKTIWNITGDSMKEFAFVPTFDQETNPKKKMVDRTEFAIQWPAQVVLCVTQVYWTRDVTRAIAGGTKVLSQYLDYQKANIDKLVDKVRGKLSKLERKTLGALTTIDVHARDVVQTMVNAQISSPNDFEWSRELRYYWEPYADSKKKSGKKGKEGKGGKSREKASNVLVRIVNAEQKYRYEYLGNSSRLVITPLTDRCYRTMIGAVALMYGGAPEGPAGTGKTETVKDLSKACAIQCVVFNCSDGLDYIQMAKFFKGLAGCGAWCCFDEFNRINIEVLSVIAQQILTIQDAKRKNVKQFQFSGALCALKVDCNCFITMNPGYAGRAELPDNLKALFRPCAMMVPNYALIAEIRLFSFGFKAAPSLAKKITMTLTLSSQQLSSQKHYDYGMRAVNTILVAAGNLRQRLGDSPLWSEDKIVLRSINDVNLPKFTLNDLPLFKGITGDLFPGVELPEQNYDTLNSALTTIMRENNIQGTEEFVLKCIQLYETVNVRHGLMVVGRTFSGKTAILHTLASALTKMNKDIEAQKSPDYRIREIFNEFDEDGSGSIDAEEFQTLAHACGETLTDEEAQATLEHLDADGNGTLEFDEFKVWMDAKKEVEDDSGKKRTAGFIESAKEAYLKDKLEQRFKARQEARNVERTERAVKVRTLNPKAVASNQLYGNFDPNTHEWSDGVLACIYRAAVKDKSDDRNWIVFDGPVDAVWIEDMNTVLDDNKKLCLMSGEIIKMSTRMNMIFEAEDLDQASPATVSRVGMVFTEPERLGTGAIVESWLRKQFKADKEMKEKVRSIFNWAFLPANWYVKANCFLPTPVTTMEMANNLLRLLGSLLKSNKSVPLNDENIHAYFCLSLIWSVGATVDAPGRLRFDDYMKRVLNGRVVGDPDHDKFRSLHPEYANTYKHPPKVLCTLPEEDTMYDYTYFVKGKKTSWVKWSNDPLITKFKIEKGTEFSSIAVPTVSTVVNNWLIDTLVITGKSHLLFTGQTGTGKTLSVVTKLRAGIDARKFSQYFMSFSARTSANQTQDIIDEKMRKRRKGVYGPPVGKRGIIFVDDLNMPAKEEYGAQPPIELLRQWMDLGGWYDRKSKEKLFLNIVDIQFVAAMGPPGGARSLITQRYVRHFNLVNLIPFDQSGLQRIFGTIIQWFVGDKSFANPVVRMLNLCVKGTTLVYDNMAAEMRPTPMKSHYLFNLRDFATVFQGVLRVAPEYLDVPNKVVRLWAHECYRVFSDRLIDDSDRKWFTNMIENTVVPETFEVKWKDVMSRDGEDLSEAPLPLMFGSYINPDAEEKKYIDVGQFGRRKVELCMQNYLEELNVSRSDGGMDIVLFQNALEHITRIARVLGQKKGNALLVGVGGSGRKSLTTIAAFVCEQKLVQIELTRTYGVFEWREDLKRILKLAGVEGQDVTFMMVDTQIVDEAFVEDINNLLNNGEVPNLFPSEEMAELMEALNESPAIAKAEKEKHANDGDDAGPADPMERYNIFVSLCQQKLHLVLAFSPIGDVFRTRLRMFPSLINCCYIDWFTKWPKEALQSVAERFLREVPLEDDERDGVIKVCVDMQSRVRALAAQYFKEVRRQYYVTPSSYLELIKTFKNLIYAKREEILSASKRYSNGLEKLSQTAKDVERMQEELTALQPKLEVATKETDEMLKNIEVKQADANELKAVVQGEEEICAKQAAEAKAIADNCQALLDEAIPALESAQKALSTLKKSDMDEVKAMKKPPGGVRLTMEAVCVLMNVKPVKVKDPNGGHKKINDYWGPAVKHLLNDTKFLKRLQKYKKDEIKDEMTAKVTPYTVMPEFQPDRIAKASKAAAGLCKWVHAMMKYTKVYKVVLPKKLELEKATNELNAAQEVLEGKRKVVREVEERVQKLKDQLDAAMEKKTQLKNEVEDCAAKLDRAERLMGGLGGERIRWQQAVKQLASSYTNVTGDVMLSAGIIAYLGAFTTKYRESCISVWADMLTEVNIPCSASSSKDGSNEKEEMNKKDENSEGSNHGPFSLETVLGNAVQIRQWTLSKLPNDSFSINNAIIMDNGSRWPLMIDPQGQANRWVRNMELQAGIKVTKQSNGGFIRAMENAVQFGTPLLIENVPEWLDPVLNPILQKRIKMVGNTPHVTLGDNDIPYDEKGFRLYLTTKLPNPHFSPDICVMLTILNFASTPEGLEDQMLGLVVKAEAPDMEKQNEQLIVEEAENQKQLKDIENTILRLLDAAEGNILDDEQLIDTLSASKVTSNKIDEKVAVAKRVKANIDKKRLGYVPIARRSASLFFCLSSLCNIDPMYQWSMQFYKDLFLLAISKAPKPNSKQFKGKNKEKELLSARLHSLIDTFQYMLYCNICASLFARHKLLFSFLLCTTIQLEKAVDGYDEGGIKLDASTLRFFLTGSTALEVSEVKPKTYETWLSDKAWGDIVGLCKLPRFGKQLLDDFTSNGAEWERIYESVDPGKQIREYFSAKSGGENDDANKSGGDSSAYNTFERMCILRCLRLDRVVPAVQDFIDNSLGARFIDPPAFDLQSSYDDSNCCSPIVFVLSTGADPIADLTKLAEQTGFSKRLTSISLGQGQGVFAEQAVTLAVDKGSWVCLQNCHLSISWLPTLERICETFKPEFTHPEFRLWLTTMPCPEFPVPVLQSSIKITKEPPKGIRASVLGSYLTFDKDWFEGSVYPEIFKKLLFSLCFFHASIIERAKYGPLGWNKPYEFSESDRTICKDQLRIFVDSTDIGERLRRKIPVMPEGQEWKPIVLPDDVYDGVVNLLPFAALKYLVGQCNYGGRVTDAQDRRTIMTILDDFYRKPILSKQKRYAFSPSGNYQLPDVGDLKHYVDKIRDLPLTDEGPEMFGLHANANITCALAESTSLLESVLSLQPRSSGGGEGDSWDTQVSNLAIAIETNLPSSFQFDVEAAAIKYPVRHDESLNTVLTQELMRFNKLLKVINDSIVEIQKAIKGIVLMSETLEKVGESMVNGTVPELWKAAAYPSLKPLNGWIKDLSARLNFYSNWIENGTPKVTWFSGLFFTQSFITGTLQNYARRQHVPIDECGFDFEVVHPSNGTAESITTSPEHGSYITGLFLEGARWDIDGENKMGRDDLKGSLAESVPKELYQAMPVIWMLPKNIKEIEAVVGEPGGTAHVYVCPTYKTSARWGQLSTTGMSTNFVINIRLSMSSKHEQAHWIKRGVALLCQLNE
jgi:dynein heavy chain